MKRSDSIPAHLLLDGSVLGWELKIEGVTKVIDLEWLIGHCMDFAKVELVSNGLTALRDHSSVSPNSGKATSRTECRERTINGVISSLRLTVDGFPGIPQVVTTGIIDDFFESVFSHVDSHIGDLDSILAVELSSPEAMECAMRRIDEFLMNAVGDQKG